MHDDATAVHVDVDDVHDLVDDGARAADDAARAADDAAAHDGPIDPNDDARGLANAAEKNSTSLAI
ncbi:MAG TPA: hypothetical protein VGG24_11265, partial [Paraburkholderia sp.]